jgi:Na+-driven multidrug efflux pump
MVAMFGTVQIAANGVAQSFWSMSALFCIAMGPAFITVIGQYMGAGDTEGAEYYMQKLLKITYLGAISWNMIFLVLSPLLLRLFDLSAEASHLALIIILLHNAFNGFFCPLAFAASNGLRAAGDVKFTMYASIFSTVICRVAFSVLFGVSMGLGVIGITLAMIADWVIHAALVLFRYRSGKWKNFRVI